MLSRQVSRASLLSSRVMQPEHQKSFISASSPSGMKKIVDRKSETRSSSLIFQKHLMSTGIGLPVRVNSRVRSLRFSISGTSIIIKIGMGMMTQCLFTVMRVSQQALRHSPLCPMKSMARRGFSMPVVKKMAKCTNST